MARFKPGQSGNPNGRPVQKPFIDWCKEWVTDLGKKHLKAIAENTKHKHQLEAIKTIYAYGVGKPVETQILDAEITERPDNSAESLAGELTELIGGSKAKGIGSDTKNPLDSDK